MERAGRPDRDDVYEALSAGMGLSWAVTYVLMIRRAVRDRTYPMPLVPLALNLAWECQYSLVTPKRGFRRAVGLTWLGLDCVLLGLTIRYGPEETGMRRRTFTGGLVASLCGAALAVRAANRWGDAHGRTTAFVQNAVMSALFLRMHRGRGGNRGQTPGIAVSKLLGSAFAAVGAQCCTDWGRARHLQTAYVASGVLDVLYLREVLRMVDGPEAS